MRKTCITVLILSCLVFSACDSSRITSQSQNEMIDLENKNKILLKDVNELESKNEELFNRLKELENINEDLSNKIEVLNTKLEMNNNRDVENEQVEKENEIASLEEINDYIETIKVYENFLNRLTEENFYQYDNLTRDKCLELIVESISFVGSTFEYAILDYDFNRVMMDYEDIKELEGYYLVTDKNIKSLTDLEDKLNLYFTKEITAKIIDRNVDVGDDKSIGYKPYKVYNEQLFTAGGECGVGHRTHVSMKYSVFKEVHRDENNKTITYTVITPLYEEIEQLNEGRYEVIYEEHFLEEQIQFKYTEDGWKLNTYIQDLRLY